MKKGVLRSLAEIFALMVVVHLLRFGIKQLFFLFAQRTAFNDRVASFVAMALLSAAFIVVAKAKKIDLSVFPKRFGVWYIVFSALTAAFFAVSLILFKASDFESILLFVYAGVVTPIFEELIFRGYIWNKLNSVFKSEWYTYLASVVLFSLWHLGYIDSFAFRAESAAALINILFWKAVIGVFFGAVLGLLRKKTKNCYSTMLLHGVMNILAR